MTSATLGGVGVNQILATLSIKLMLSFDILDLIEKITYSIPTIFVAFRQLLWERTLLQNLWELLL